MKILCNLNNSDINIKQTIKRKNSVNSIINQNSNDNKNGFYCRDNVGNASQKIPFHAIYMKTPTFGKRNQNIFTKIRRKYLGPFKDEKILPETKDAYIGYLKSLKDQNGNPRFDDFSISDLANTAISENINIFFVKDLADLMTNNGKPRFNSDEISYILPQINPKNAPFVKNLADLTTKNGTPVFDGYGISKVLPYVDSKNIHHMKNLAEMTTEFGDPLFQYNDYKNLLPVVNSENIPIVKKFADLDAEKAVFLNFNWDIPIILPAINAKNINPVENLVNMAVQGGETRLDGHNVRAIAEIIQDENTLKKLYGKIEEQRKLELKTPEKYVDKDCNSKEKMIEDINKFFDKNILSLTKLSYVFDKKTFDKLMSLGLRNASEYLDAVQMFDTEELKTLKNLCDSKNVYNEPFKSKQKIEFIDLLYAYKKYDMLLFKMQSMIKSGKINTEILNNVLFAEIIKNSQQARNRIFNISSKEINSWEEKVRLFINDMEKEIQLLLIGDKK